MITLISMALRYWVYLDLVDKLKRKLKAENPDADMSTFKVTNFEFEPPAHRWYPRLILIDVVIVGLVVLVVCLVQ